MGKDKKNSGAKRIRQRKEPGLLYCIVCLCVGWWGWGGEEEKFKRVEEEETEEIVIGDPDQKG